jgi:flotillin
MDMFWIVGAGAIALFVTAIFFVMVTLRRVVPTNMVHIVQSSKATTAFGRGKETGNTYYAWPAWLPRIGVSVIQFQESIFQVTLKEYAAYDKGRLPFKVDVTAFFRVADAEVAAQRVTSFEELKQQLQSVLQGAVRRILATNDLEEIMHQRATLGQQFTDEVDHNIKEWGVQTVKVIEFMHIQDDDSSKVIHNIQAKEQARIDRESRTKVAENRQLAETAEIEAQRQIDIQSQEAAQQVGIRKAEQEKAVGIAREKSSQDVQEQAKITAEKSMEVKRVQDTKRAEIERAVTVTNAEAEKQRITLGAEASLAATTKEAEGIKLKGEAEGDAATKRLMAPVTAQMTLAEKIGSNEGYQSYLIRVEQVRAGQVVGEKLADAIKEAKIQVISTGGGQGDVLKGVAGIGDLFTPAGAATLSGAIAAFASTDQGKAVMDNLLGAAKPATTKPATPAATK